MEIQIFNPTNNQPLPSVQWNYEEVKAWLSDGLKRYDGIVYDENQITQAKKDRANLNKLADAIDAKRKEMKAVYLQPYSEFEAQAKELTAMVKSYSDSIGAQIKAFDDFKKQQKREEIKKLFEQIFGDLAKLVPFERIENPKWLNVTTSITSITEEIAGHAERIEKGLAAIDQMQAQPEIADHLKSAFLKKFDLADVFAEKERFEKQREELARYAAERAVKVEDAPQPTPQPIQAVQEPTDVESVPAEPLRTVIFKVEATDMQLAALKAFLKANNIKFGRP